MIAVCSGKHCFRGGLGLVEFSSGLTAPFIKHRRQTVAGLRKRRSRLLTTSLSEQYCIGVKVMVGEKGRTLRVEAF